MKKTLLLFILGAAVLSVPAQLAAQSGIIFRQSSGTVTGQLNMGGYAIWSSSAVTAAYYQINGSTVLALLSGLPSNLGIGLDAGRGNTEGAFNSFLGSQAGYSNTEGGDNSFVGASAGYSNIAASYNSFLGSEAGYSNLTGESNVFIGYGAGYSNTTGNNNSFVSASAGFSNTTGESNSIMGTAAGQSSKTGSANVIFGAEAAYGVALNSFSSSTIVGYRAGFGLTTGSDNILLGFQAGYAVTAGTGNIVIGYAQDTSAAGANNELNIGGLIYGTGLNGAGGAAGIGTASPEAALDVKSTGTATGVSAQIWRNAAGTIMSSMSATGLLTMSSGVISGSLGVGVTDPGSARVWLQGNDASDFHLQVSSQDSTGNLLVVKKDGNVGIGTASPAYALSIYRVGTSTFNIESGGDGTVVQNRMAGKSDTSVAQVWGAGMNISDSKAGYEVYDYTAGASRVYISSSSGKVGIGTATPGQTLAVNGGFVYSMTQNSVTGSRSFDTAYQNTTGRIMYVSVAGSRTNTGTIVAFTDAAADPTAQVAAASGTTGYMTPVFFIVLPGNYYKVTDTGGTTLSSWVEWY